ncbi:hypothetical protein SAMN02745866_00316 [Alteromonadaceae bacterium Bs31]|nr:hypothetical protein SAMN02745866_00316 [Alteromonadaceae bacterium Bs31]
MTYKVLWKELWLSLSKYMAIAITIPVLIVFVIRYVKYGYDFGAAFPHLNLINSLVIGSGIAIFCIAFAWLIALWAGMAKISISNGIIQGRNYWGFKNSFPLSESVSSYNFSNNGINAIVLVSRNSGKIYISLQTEKLNELLDLIEPYILKNNEKNA